MFKVIKLYLSLFIFVFIIFQVNAATNNSFSSILPNETVKIDLSITEDNALQGFFGVSTEEVIENRIEDLKDNYRVSYVAETVNRVTLEVTKEELVELQQSKEVYNIKKSLDFSLSLQDSINIINSSFTGNLQVNGINLTGTGQTVCIIDSGINYTHPDFGSCTTEQFLNGDCDKIIGGRAYYYPVNSSNQNDIMGDSDHGTHVAGIIARIAPDAKIAAIKACNSAGICEGNAILDGINWCVLNSELYNITVISMSLGSDVLFNYYCDGVDGQFTSAINSAVAKNISVIAASGNNGNNTHISLPACIKNATAVTATNKDDSIASYGNRNFMSVLAAPGTNINSSALNGEYVVYSGTSMATPHVAAAFAVIKQVISFLNVSMQPKEIDSLFNSTGLKITDSTGQNYSRINLYNATISIDSLSPSISLISPQNNFTTTNQTILFSANVSDWELVNFTFILMNSSGDLVNETIFNITGSYYQVNISVEGLANSTYNWSFFAVDSKMNSATSTRNLTIGPEQNESNTTTQNNNLENNQNQIVTTRSGGGGGGGGSATQFKPTEAEIVNGYTKILGKQEVIQFVLSEEAQDKHTLTLNSVEKNYVNITIKSNPIKLTLEIGESLKLNMTSLHYYDLFVKLENIINGKAEITIKNINEQRPKLPELTEYSGNNTFSLSDKSESQLSRSNSWIYALSVIFAIIVVTLIVHFLHIKRRKMKR